MTQQLSPPRMCLTIRQAVNTHLFTGLIPFWRERALDGEYGGFMTNFDGEGKPYPMPEKYLNTQCRLVWWFSTTYKKFGHERDRELARQGVDFLLKYCWEPTHEGWRWKVQRNGTPLDDGKVVYGQSFAIYALSEYYLATGDIRGLEYASRTFDLLQKYCADTRNGGYYENLEADWQPAPDGWCGGDRKGLDTHMHLMEAFTTLYQASGREIHRRKLLEVIELIFSEMVDYAYGCGLNQFDLAWNPVPAIAIRRTWNAERDGETPADPTETTSYGHNTELVWLMRRALQVAGVPSESKKAVIKLLLDNAVAHGVDWEKGGIYRDGLRRGGPLVLEKEWWQHTEALVGFLDGYQLLGDAQYWHAFENIWNFCNRHMINHQAGAWRRLLSREGDVIDPTLGNEWKASYHSSRAMLECNERLAALAGKAQPTALL